MNKRCTHATSILPSGLLVAPMTLVLSLNFNPCFWRIRWKFLEISMSMPIPPTWLRNSTAVTLAPSLCHTDPWKQTEWISIIKPNSEASSDCKCYKEAVSLQFRSVLCWLWNETPQSLTHQLYANDSSSNHDELLWNLLKGQSAGGRDNGVFINLSKEDHNYTWQQTMQENCWLQILFCMK